MTAGDIVAAALNLPDPADRTRFVARACGDDVELRSAVERLLETALTQTMDGRALVAAANLLTDAAGARIGPYVLKSILGAGGMGVVYLAEQQHPVRRDVALKIIKPGSDTPQVIARFEAERQALAAMDHPNIAKVLDAGTTAEGRPYFAMELVAGVPITRYCDANRLDVRQRLQLFVPVCQAVQHAHQKGIIHRDIKPSNILVPVYDGKAVPKVIDFGIAKAIQPSPGDPLLTQAGAIIGTLDYMSPEQAESGGIDLDTRSDIYSLGAVLYELLTATTPHHLARGANGGYLEVLRLLHEVEPPRPSARLTESRETLETVAAHRSTNSLKLPKLIRGDLDWIVLKALEKDRTRRYASANGLVRDVERYLSGEPVEASPPSAMYRFRKFASRHRALLATAAAFGVLLIAATAISTREAIRANRERDRAVRALHEAESERLAGYASASLAEDPERSIALGIYAVEATRKYGQYASPGALSVLHAAILASHVRMSLADHSQEVRDLSFSPDGRTLATASDDKTAKIWDVGTGKALFTFEHPDWVWSVAFSPDGKRLATGSTDRMVRIWDIASQSIVMALRGHGHSVMNVAFSPDGRLLASASVDQSAILWDAATGRMIRTFRGHSKRVNSVAFSPDGKRLATAGGDGTIRIWDVHTGRELLQVRDEGGLTDAVFSPDGKLLAGSGVQLAKVWDANTGREVVSLRGLRTIVKKLAFAPDGRRLAVAAADGTVRLWDTSTGQELTILRGHRGNVPAAAFSADGGLLATGGADHLVKLWDTGLDSELGVLSARAFLLNRDGSRAVAATPQGTLEIWNVETGSRITAIPTAPALHSETQVAISGDGKRCAVASGGGAVTIWSAISGKKLAAVFPETEVEYAALSQDGALLAIGGADHTAKLWTLSRQSGAIAFQGHRKLVDSVAFSPDGTLLLTGSVDGTIKLWDTATARVLRTIGGFSAPWVTFAPVSTRILGLDGAGAHLWDTSAGRELRTIRGHQAFVRRGAFSPDGNRLATADADGVIKVWATGSGEELFTVRGGHAAIFDVAFNQDGTRLVSADQEGVTRVYAADPDMLLRLAKQRLTRSLTAIECRTYFQSDRCPALP